MLKEEEKRLEEDRIRQLITQFKLNPDEELIPVSDQWYDANTNLIWQRCSMGEHWQNGQITGMAELMNWDEKEAYLERFKDTGWRLPQYQELITLSFPEYVGYITKNGYEFYEKIHTNFYNSWITPFFKIGSELTCVVSVSEGTSQYSKHKSEPDLKGYIRLVRWAC
ncbi:MAG: DUF1566 domain-containing protein [Moraxellaceae bacterium]|nr:DUF1566 domain-containing protein [Moraxellaceae bacterium]